MHQCELQHLSFRVYGFRVKLWKVASFLPWSSSAFALLEVRIGVVNVQQKNGDFWNLSQTHLGLLRGSTGKQGVQKELGPTSEGLHTVVLRNFDCVGHNP